MDKIKSLSQLEVGKAYWFKKKDNKTEAAPFVIRECMAKKYIYVSGRLWEDQILEHYIVIGPIPEPSSDMW